MDLTAAERGDNLGATRTVAIRVVADFRCPHSPLTDVKFEPQAAPVDNEWCPFDNRTAASRINFDLDNARAVFY